MFINIGCFMFSQVQQALQVTGTGDFEAGYPSPQTHPWQDLRSFLQLCRKDQLSIQAIWLSLTFLSCHKTLLGGKTQEEVATSGHFPRLHHLIKDFLSLHQHYPQPALPVSLPFLFTIVCSFLQLPTVPLQCLVPHR